MIVVKQIGLIYLHYEPRQGQLLGANASAEAFSVHLTGFCLRMWSLYGDKLLLPRFGKGHDPVPEHLVPVGNQARGVYFLTGGWQRPVAAMLVVRQHQMQPESLAPEMTLQELYDISGLQEGVDYVHYVPQTPAGYYTQTEAGRDNGR